MQTVRADHVTQQHVRRYIVQQAVEAPADRREEVAERGRPGWRDADRTRHRRSHHLERRTASSRGVRLQLEAVYGPHVPLPPFGHSDIRRLRNYELAARRILDVVVASAVLAIATPMMLLIAVSVKCTSHGSVFYRHQRVGLGGRPFEVIKFRSMRAGTDRDVQVNEEDRRDYIQNGFKLRATDPRITRIGRVLRRTSLDELPQLVNVLKGEMSIVGVRPLVREELGLRPEIDQVLYRRLRPGMTGLWQISGRSNVLENHRIAMDRAYMANWRPLLDVTILLKTPRSLLRVDDAA